MMVRKDITSNQTHYNKSSWNTEMVKNNLSKTLNKTKSTFYKRGKKIKKRKRKRKENDEEIFSIKKMTYSVGSMCEQMVSSVIIYSLITVKLLHSVYLVN